MTKKIKYIGNFNDVSCEGLIIIIKKIKKYFSKYELNNNKLTENIFHIHSSGFYESIKYQKLKSKKIYSLHSNINNNFLKLIKDYWDYYFKLYSIKNDHYSKKDRIIKMSMGLLSNLTPFFIKKYFLKKMDIIIVPNKLIFHRLKIENSQIIYQGIDIKKFKKTKKQKNKKILNIKYLGHSASAKGLIETISAFNILGKNYNTELFLTSLNPKLTKYIKKHSPKTKVHGLIKNIVKEYNNSDIIVLPYRHSGGAIATPLVLIESMACECTIITSDLPSLKEICGDSVIYVKPYSVKDIVKKVNYLAKNPKLRKELGKKARKRVVKYYNQEKMFKEYEKLYQKTFNKINSF